jgi:hypothetical protein
LLPRPASRPGLSFGLQLLNYSKIHCHIVWDLHCGG